MQLKLVATGVPENGRLSEQGKKQIAAWADVHLPVGSKAIPVIYHDGSPAAEEAARYIATLFRNERTEEARALGIHRLMGDQRVNVPNFPTVKAFLDAWDLTHLLRRRLNDWIATRLVHYTRSLDDSFVVVGVGHPRVIGLATPTPESLGMLSTGDGVLYSVVPDQQKVCNILSCTPLENPLKAR